MLARRRLGSLGAAAIVAPTLLSRAIASTWPERPVRLVVPFGPGGAIDVLARILAPHFPAQTNGQPLVVENRGGAGGTIGAAHVAQSRPDGHTLMMAELGSSAIAHELYRSLPYDPPRAFTPIIFLADLPLVLVARTSLPLRDPAALLTEARLRPGSVSYATVGSGHIGHLALELLQRQAGEEARLLHVPYRSGAEVIGAILKGEADLSLLSFSTALPFIRSGQARALAVASREPSQLLPDVPTIASAVPGFEASLWYGIAGPADIPPGIVARANAAFNAVLALPEVAETIRRQQSAEIIGGPPERFAAHLRAEAARWAPVVRAAGIRAE